MEKRKIFRGNFVNFMTAMTDLSVVRGSHYVLRIVEEDGKHYCYEVAGGQIFDIPETTILKSSVLTDWQFLSENVQNHHLFKRDGFFYQNVKQPYRFEINFDSKYAWADKFQDLLPRDVVLKLYEEIGEFEEITFIKSYLHEINDTVYKVSEYKIDSDWYLYLGRWRLYGEVFSISFEYNIKNYYYVRHGKEDFKKTCQCLQRQYPMPFKFIKIFLRSCNCDIGLCSSILADILNTRKLFLTSEMSKNINLVDEFYVDYLRSADYLGFRHFIKGFAYIYNNFKFVNKSLKQQLANYMLGK